MIEEPAARSEATRDSTRTERPLLFLLLLVVVPAIGYADYLSGADIGFSLFYLVPIVLAAWRIGKAEGIVVALCASASWFVAEHAGRSSLAIALWNGGTRLVIYVSQAWLVATLHEDRIRQADLARTDSLTGLPNSRSFNETLGRLRRRGRPLSLLYLDLDRFKEINDRYGHSRGDEVLERVGRGLRASIRNGDVAARVAGDEFVILLPGAERETAERVCERVSDFCKRIAAEFPDTGFGVSVGIAISSAAELSADELIGAADRAMYDAKRSRRGSSVVRQLD